MQSQDLWSVLTKVGLAIVILIVTWILAAIVKWAIGKLVTKIPALQRDGSNGQQIGKSVGQIAGLIIWPEFHNFSAPQNGPAVAHPRFFSLPR
jgi:hypothetical protein